MEDNEKLGKHICVSIKTSKFEAKTKNMILEKYIKGAEDIFNYSW